MVNSLQPEQGASAFKWALPRCSMCLLPLRKRLRALNCLRA